jgi:hypothetical protein
MSLHCYEDSTKGQGQQWSTTSYNSTKSYFAHFAVAHPLAQAFVLLSTDAVLYPVVPPPSSSLAPVKSIELETPRPLISTPVPTPIVPTLTPKEQRAKVLDILPKATSSELAADDTCNICMSSMEVDPDEADEVPKKLGCGHIFHKHCLRSWFDKPDDKCPSQPSCNYVVPIATLAAPTPSPTPTPLPAASPLSLSRGTSGGAFASGGAVLAAASGSRGLGGAPNVVGSALAAINAAAAQAALEAKQVIIPISYASTWRHIPWTLLFANAKYEPRPVVFYHPTVLAENLINGNYQRVKNVLYYLYQCYCENPKLKQQKNPIVSLPWDYVLNEGKVATAPTTAATATTSSSATDSKAPASTSVADTPAKQAADDTDSDDEYDLLKKKKPIAVVDPMDGAFDMGAFGGGFGSSVAKKKKSDSDDDNSDDEGHGGSGGDPMDSFNFGGGGFGSAAKKPAETKTPSSSSTSVVAVKAKAPAPPKSIPLKSKFAFNSWTSS